MNRTEFRVRYGETDQMGIVHHATYPLYFEMGRTELFRQLGIPYTKLEAMGIIMPLSSLTIKYISPAKYDDLLVVETSICEFTPLKIVMTYNIVTKGHQVLTTGETTLISVDATSRKPKRLSASIFELINTAIRNDV